VLLDRLLIKRGDHLSLFTAPAALDRDYDAVRQSTPCVIVDIPHTWTPWVKACLIAADEIVIVATPDLASLRNAKNIVDLVRAARPNDAPPRVVLNKVGVPGRPEIPIREFGDALGLPPAMVIAFDAKLFGQAANNGQMIAEVGPKSKQAESLEGLARMISRRETAAEEPAARPAASFLSRFDRLFKR